MKRGYKTPKLIKTSISLPEEIWEFAVEEAQHGYNSVSAYIADIIRHARDDDKPLRVPAIGRGNEGKSTLEKKVIYPSHHDEFTTVQDAEEPLKKKKAK